MLTMYFICIFFTIWFHFSDQINLAKPVLFLNSINFWAFAIFFFLCYNNYELLNNIDWSNKISQNFFYKIFSWWNNHEGSLLLMILLIKNIILISVFSYHKNLFSQKIKNELFILWLLFEVLLIHSSNPVIRLEDIDNSINVFNPILQDIFLLFHPPILFVGYIGTLICYLWTLDKFALNEFPLIQKLIFFLFTILSIGILLGSWWAYNELGWGGWWFWDPVENISLIPWLLMIITFHIFNNTKNLIRQQENLLIFLLFFIALLTIFGSWIIRSGILTSVHNFAFDLSRAIFLLLLVMKLIIGFLFLNNSNINKNKFEVDVFNKYNWAFYIMAFISLFIIFATFAGIFTPNFLNLKATFFNRFLNPWVIVGLSLIFTFTIVKMRLNKNGAFEIYGLGFLIISLFCFFLLENVFLAFLVSFVLLYWLTILVFHSTYLNLKFHLIHFVIIGILLIFYISKVYSLDFSKIVIPGDLLIIDKNIYIEYINTCLSFNVENFWTWLYYFNITSWSASTMEHFPNYIQKLFYYQNDLYMNKHNILSNLIQDIIIYSNAGNIFNGWFFKISLRKYISFLWILGIFFIIVLFYLFYNKNFYYIKNKVWVKRNYFFKKK